MKDEADLVDNAVKKVLAEGYATADIMHARVKQEVGTAEMGSTIISIMREFA